MNLIRRWFWLIAIALMTISSVAQDDETSPNGDEDTVFIQVWMPAMSETAQEMTDEIFGRIVSALTDSGINHQFVDAYPSTYGENSVVIRFYQIGDTENNTLLISMSSNGRYLSDISPLLHDNYDHTIAFNAIKNEIPLNQLISDMAIGLAYYATAACSQATRYFDIALNNLPEVSAQIAFLKGNCAIIAENYETAARHFEASLSQIEDDISYFENTVTNLAWVYVQLGQGDDAIALMDDFVDAARCSGEPIGNLSPVFTGPPTCESEALAYRAQIHALLFDFDAAVADIDAAIALDPENPSLHVQRGQIVVLLYEWDRVLENYDTAIALDPGYADAYFHRGVLYYTVLERETALADFERYLELQRNREFFIEATNYIESIRTELDSLSP